jgi:hypothetical protein
MALVVAEVVATPENSKHLLIAAQCQAVLVQVLAAMAHIQTLGIGLALLVLQIQVAEAAAVTALP